MTTAETPDDFPFQNGPDGWPLVRRLLADALQIYGGPAKIMFGRMREGARRGIRNLDRRLRALLELVRRLILIEALLITAPDIKRRGKRKPKRALPKVEIIPLTAQHWVTLNDKPRLSEDPSKWRVSLQLFPIVGVKPANPPPPLFNTSRNKARSLMLLFRRIANRLEALRRIAADPAKYARRADAQAAFSTLGARTISGPRRSNQRTSRARRACRGAEGAARRHELSAFSLPARGGCHAQHDGWGGGPTLTR